MFTISVKSTTDFSCTKRRVNSLYAPAVVEKSKITSKYLVREVCCILKRQTVDTSQEPGKKGGKEKKRFTEREQGIPSQFPKVKWKMT